MATQQPTDATGAAIPTAQQIAAAPAAMQSAQPLAPAVAVPAQPQAPAAAQQQAQPPQQQQQQQQQNIKYDATSAMARLANIPAAAGMLGTVLSDPSVQSNTKAATVVQAAAGLLADAQKAASEVLGALRSAQTSAAQNEEAAAAYASHRKAESRHMQQLLKSAAQHNPQMQAAITAAGIDTNATELNPDAGALLLRGLVTAASFAGGVPAVTLAEPQATAPVAVAAVQQQSAPVAAAVPAPGGDVYSPWASMKVPETIVQAWTGAPTGASLW